MVRLQSKQPRKQRKARYNAPSHVKSKYLNAPLSPALRQDYTKKTLRVVKGDMVIIKRGTFKGYEGRVESLDMRSLKLLIKGISSKKADGKEIPCGIDASNVQIVTLNLDDKRRKEKLTETR